MVNTIRLVNTNTKDNPILIDGTFGNHLLEGIWPFYMYFDNLAHRLVYYEDVQ